MSFALPDVSMPAIDGGAKPDSPAIDLAQSFGAIVAQLHLRLGGSASAAQDIALAAATASLSVSEGHACVPLAALPASVCQSLSQSPVAIKDPQRARREANAVLVIDRQRLYLQRYWRYEVWLAASLIALDAQLPVASEAAMLAMLDTLFQDEAGQINWQRVAVATALTRRIAVITGGPGTGKTQTVARFLVALSALAPDVRIALAAPTGKAALRLEQSVREQFGKDRSGPLHRGLSVLKAQTVHRLLGPRMRFGSQRSDLRRPLAYDAVVIDEASMLDLALAAKLADALPASSRLILVGDADQLASVETGSVFFELASLAARDEAYAGRLSGLAKAPARDLFSAEPGLRPSTHPLGNSVVVLKTSYRYQSGGVIGRFAALVRAGNVSEAIALAKAGHDELQLASAVVEADTFDLIIAHFDGYFAALKAGAAAFELLRLFAHYRILTALRQGPLGSVAVNARLEQHARRAVAAVDGAMWYSGRPVIVTQNDAQLQLFNGDIGITLEDARGALSVYFEDASGTRAFAPSRLPHCETAFALTVHKSQGSEFDTIDVMLAPEDSPLAQRELIYTAVTRARKSVRLWGSEAALAAAIARPGARFSALAERLVEKKP